MNITFIMEFDILYALALKNDFVIMIITIKFNGNTKIMLVHSPQTPC